ncbi:organic cation transporter protein isoform X1 [Microplitis demolitor]|uniref:organic cation transporter protein isoform X1 n=1 Tax=Microplitis demolitor TaxID=69319 RepID=UPI0004CD7DCA|nr:organic cation transporter protein isoform X1 [Microplitis demolitor]XP_008560213.1 organic cation transporter protein isoform X1 [Microplitis demolitor]
MEDQENEEVNLTFAVNEKQDANESIHLSNKNLNDLDRLGKYQLIVYVVVSLPLMLAAGFALGYVFTSGEVDYRCIIPECDSTLPILNTTWSEYSSPKKNSFGSCEHFTVTKDKLEKICTSQSFTNKTERCNNWVYDPHEKTILNEWDITCNENRWKLTLVGTINNLGQLVGLMFAGYLSDRYGRRTLLVSQTFLSGIVGIIQSFSVNYLMFIIFEFMQSVTSAGIYSTGFILILEIAGEKRRVLSGTIMCCVYALGEMLLGLTAMGLKSWRNIIRVFFAPSLLAILLPFVVPESIRWLIAKKKFNEVEKIYRKISKVNGIKWNNIEMSVYKQLNSKIPTQEKKIESYKNSSPVTEALSRPKLLIRLLACCFCWLTNTFVYYGLSLNSVAFAGDKYVNFILVSFVEIPAYFLSWILIDYAGRKRTLSGSFLLSGFFCLCIQFIPKDSWSYAPIIIYMSGKGCITMAFAAVYVYTAEMFPTTARHFLLSICSMTGRIGSILAPQTRLLAIIVESLPLILFGSMGIAAGIISLIFPETLGCKLPDTIEEAENIGYKSDKKSVNIN